MTPPGCDLRHLRMMLVDRNELLNSKLNLASDAAAFRAGVFLLLNSWDQVPAGSWPDDDAVLARGADMHRDVKAWLALREEALADWVKCKDGRFYHPMVAERALEQWLRNRAASLRSMNGNAARHGTIIDSSNVQAQIDEALDMLAKLNPNSPELAKYKPRAVSRGGTGGSHKERAGSRAGSEENRTEPNRIESKTEGEEQGPRTPVTSALDVDQPAQLGSDWQPSAESKALGRRLGLKPDEIQSAANNFKDHFRHTGKAVTDPETRFKQWLAEDAKKRGRTADVGFI